MKAKAEAEAKQMQAQGLKRGEDFLDCKSGPTASFSFICLLFVLNPWYFFVVVFLVSSLCGVATSCHFASFLFFIFVLRLVLSFSGGPSLEPAPAGANQLTPRLAERKGPLGKATAPQKSLRTST